MLLSTVAFGKADKFRVMWREDPATTMVIGWNQVSGSNPVLLLDVVNRADDWAAFAETIDPSTTNRGKGMNNHFVRLTNLYPNTVYYFAIRDSEGISRKLSFKTAPNDQNERLSIIAGGDSRNNIEARREANILASRLRAHCILFGGDMTGDDTGAEWRQWLDDWQLTIARDGRITPIIVARGNHEQNNQSLIDIFDVKARDLYYALSMGDGLVRFYTLNSMIPSGGNQRAWLERDLKANNQSIWKFVQYHQTTRPHTAKKPDKNEQYENWSKLFYKYSVDVVVESDAHVVKSTWPIRPSNEPGNDEGFIRDNENGTVYIGEGCWGAPLRAANDDKAWTRASGSFNQFKWIFIDKKGIEIRTLKTDGSRRVASVDPANAFAMPNGLNVWDAPNGSVIRIRKFVAPPPPPMQNEEDLLAVRGLEISDFAAALSDSKVDIQVVWAASNEPFGLLYELQRSIDNGENYETIKRINGKGGPQCDYTFMDWGFARNHPGTYVSYRLKSILPDGQTYFHGANSDRRKNPVDRPIQQRTQKPPSPSTPSVEFQKLDIPIGAASVNINFNHPGSRPCAILILNPKRELVKRVPIGPRQRGKFKHALDISDLSPGHYQVIVKSGKQVLAKYRTKIH